MVVLLEYAIRGCFEIVEEITFDFNKYDDFAPTLNQENIKIDIKQI